MSPPRASHPRRAPSRLLSVLAMAALLGGFVLPAPVVPQPAPTASDGGPQAGLLQWLERFLAGLGLAPEAPDGPEAAFLPEGCSMDPGGTPCPKEGAGLTVPTEVREGSFADPGSAPRSE